MQRGGESCVDAGILGEGGKGATGFGVPGTGVLATDGAGANGVTGGGVWGVNNSSDVLAGLPKPDSLWGKNIIKYIKQGAANQMRENHDALENISMTYKM